MMTSMKPVAGDFMLTLLIVFRSTISLYWRRRHWTRTVCARMQGLSDHFTFDLNNATKSALCNIDVNWLRPSAFVNSFVTTHHIHSICSLRISAVLMQIKSFRKKTVQYMV